MSELGAPGATYATALSTFDKSLLSIGATGKAAKPVTALIAEDEVVVSDLRILAGISPAEFASWGAKLEEDGAAAIAARDAVRSDGLTSATS